ncbi:TPA: hypothetical protein QCX66_002850 [Bacillus mycoides]|uniref:hypothetical protein n=1 Tax=Bacillus sp. FSL M7-1431 TaxID=2978219 RepID=UPI0030F62AA2|nr:hypothetical protein [Bacillus mycoides]
MKYFEFNNHEYWALVVAETKGRAYTVYAKEVAGDGTQSVIDEGDIIEVTKEIAFGKFLNAVAQLEEYKELSLYSFVDKFLDHENQTVLITSELT